MIVPSAGVPRPVSGSKDPKKTNNTAQSVYRGREMDEMAKKKREDTQRQLALQKRALQLKEMDLRAQEEKYNTLRREITQLENKSRGSTVINTRSAIDLKNSERQSAEQIARDEREIKTLEQDMMDLDRKVESGKVALITQKEQEEKQEFTHINQIKDEIKRKTLELKTAEDEDRGLRQEIAELRKQPKDAGAQKASEEKARIEKLKGEISTLNQSLGVKRQQSDKVGNDLLGNQKLLQEKVQESKLAANRIAVLDQEIRMIKDRILVLER
jgi:chromosome segregation ATPase